MGPALRSWLSLAALACVVAALAAWIYHKPDARHGETYALSQIKAADVKRIRLERQAPAETADARPPEPIELERREAAWRITAPFSARAEGSQVDRLLTLLDARSVARYAATGLERYGLREPQVRITLDAQSFSFGTVNAATREQYVLTNEAVYAIPLAQRTAVPRDADALISRSLFAPGETVVRIELADFSATLGDGAWTFAPAAENAGPDERNAWAERWRQALAVRAARHDGRTAEGSVTVALKDGRTLALGILQREPELVLLRPDEGIQYHFLTDAGRRLLLPPGGAKSDVVTK